MQEIRFKPLLLILVLLAVLGVVLAVLSGASVRDLSEAFFCTTE